MLSPKINADENVVEVYGEEVVLPELGRWLQAIEEQGYVAIPDWLDADRTRRLRDDLRPRSGPSPTRPRAPRQVRAGRADDVLNAASGFGTTFT